MMTKMDLLNLIVALEIDWNCSSIKEGDFIAVFNVHLNALFGCEYKKRFWNFQDKHNSLGLCEL